MGEGWEGIRWGAGGTLCAKLSCPHSLDRHHRGGDGSARRYYRQRELPLGAWDELFGHTNDPRRHEHRRHAAAGARSAVGGKRDSPAANT